MRVPSRFRHENYVIVCHDFNLDRWSNALILFDWPKLCSEFMLKHDNFYLKMVHKTHFRHQNHRECRDFWYSWIIYESQSWLEHAYARRVIVFNVGQNLKGSLIRISEFPEASVMIEQLRVGITSRSQVVFSFISSQIRLSSVVQTCEPEQIRHWRIRSFISWVGIIDPYRVCTKKIAMRI